jgi:hypothetical protein
LEKLFLFQLLNLLGAEAAIQRLQPVFFSVWKTNTFTVEKNGLQVLLAVVSDLSPQNSTYFKKKSVTLAPKLQ